jgi:hypothetical protein
MTSDQPTRFAPVSTAQPALLTGVFVRVASALVKNVVGIVLAVLILSVTAAVAYGQARPARADTLSTRVRDSLIAAVLADTLDLAADTTLLLATLPSFRQTFTLRPTMRSYTVGNVNASEQASYASWVARFRHATLRVDATPVSYTGDTNTSVADRPQVVFGGLSPISARLDVPLRRADTLRVFAQTMSFPGALSTIDAQALGAVGTSTVDLDAGALGIAARVGARYTLTQRLGHAGVALTLRGGVEYDPKPSGNEAVSWRGTTIRGALGLGRSVDAGTFGASVEMTQSYSDSLGGRNLFPGGGTVTFDARALRYVGANGDGFISLIGFYAKPVGIQRPDQPTRLIPVGDFGGVTVSTVIPVRAVTLLPVFSVLRESSNARAIVNNRNTTLAASGHSATASFGVTVPIGRVLTLTPEIGGVFGNVSQTISAQYPRRRVRQANFSDAIRGRWVSLEFSVSR